MEIIQVKDIERHLWLEALHVKGQADELLRQQMDKSEEMLIAAAVPRVTYRVMERDSVKTEGFSVEKHLEGCHKVIIMALTLGSEIDSLIRKMQIVDMAMAIIMDTGASLMTEWLTDEYESQIKAQLEETAETDIYFTSRFSPGYGDYPLREQARVLRYLNASRRIGLNVTSESLMIPRKSVTALIGIANVPVNGNMAGCDECVLKEKCTLRKEGKFCGDKF